MQQKSSLSATVSRRESVKWVRGMRVWHQVHNTWAVVRDHSSTYRRTVSVSVWTSAGEAKKESIREKELCGGEKKINHHTSINRIEEMDWANRVGSTIKEVRPHEERGLSLVLSSDGRIRELKSPPTK